IRRLETPPTDEKGEPVDPIEEILKATAGDPLAEDSQLRSLRTGVDVSLKSQHDRAAALLKQFAEPPEGAKDEFNDLKKLVDEAAEMNKQASWDPDKSWAGPTLSKQEL